MLEPSDILFVGLGKSSVLWYRCALPAIHLGADWVGVYGEPPGIQVMTGLVKGETHLPRYDDYKVIVLQQVFGRAWLKQINALRERGITVLYECDDYLHGVAKQPHHDFAKYYTKDRLKSYEICMRACDGIICSTDYIARRYAKFNRNVYVCRNGLDVRRYRLTRPERRTINVGWAGATGHIDALLPWLNALIEIMHADPRVCFVSIGQAGLAAPINQIVGPDRAIGIPFAPLECYPAAMCMFDIALAPATQTAWYRGKSDLRWLEAGALGVPTIGDRLVYNDITTGVDGFWAQTPAEMSARLLTLLSDDRLRTRMGEAAREHVHSRRTSEIAAAQWFEALAAAHGGYESVAQLRRT